MRVTLVHNPGAGDDSHSGERLLQELAGAGYEARLVSGKKDLDRALENPGELVVAAGGDGSIKRVAVALAGRAVPMAVLPIGTANNIAKSLGVFGMVRELIAGWEGAARRPLRVGTVTAGGAAMRFVESVGVGVFSELISRGESEAGDNTAGLTGHELDRALLLLKRILLERRPRRRRLSLDGADLSGEYILVEAMNIPLVGPNVALAPGADCSDGHLDLVMVPEESRTALAEYVRARLSGAAAPLELPRRRGAQVSLDASPDELHVDDDPWKPPRAWSGDAEEVAIALDEAMVEVLVPPGPLSQAPAAPD